MSRVGRVPVTVPDKVSVKLEGGVVKVEGPKGKLSQPVPQGIAVDVADKAVTVKRLNDRQVTRALHGLTRTLVQNMVFGVTTGFSKELEIQGVGLKAQIDKQTLTLSLGYSHPVTYQVPAGVTVETPKPTQIVVRGVDKALVGQVAATIRSFYEAEPYKGTGIRYVGEVIRRKTGKAVATKA